MPLLPKGSSLLIIMANILFHIYANNCGICYAIFQGTGFVPSHVPQAPCQITTAASTFWISMCNKIEQDTVTMHLVECLDKGDDTCMVVIDLLHIPLLLVLSQVCRLLISTISWMYKSHQAGLAGVETLGHRAGGMLKAWILCLSGMMGRWALLCVHTQSLC